MNSRKKQFIAGAVCPNCNELDSLVLFADDQSVACVSCDYHQTSEQRDTRPSSAKTKQNSKNITVKPDFKDASSISVINLDE